MSAKYLVVRGPSTMEDEGRHFVHGDTDTKAHAKKIAKKFGERSKGYYSFDVYQKID